MGEDLVWFDAGVSLRAIVEQARTERARHIVLRDGDRWFAFDIDDAIFQVPDDRPARGLIADLWSNPVRGPASVIEGTPPVLSWTGGSLSLIGAEVTIGRAAGNTIRTDLVTVSKHQARIYRSERGYVLEDAGSAGGTFVNDKHVAERVLRHGDLIQCGELQLRFSDPPRDRASTHPAGAQAPIIVLGPDGLPIRIDGRGQGPGNGGGNEKGFEIPTDPPLAATYSQGGSTLNEGTSVTRYPSIDSRELGADVLLTIDLARAPVDTTLGDPVTLTNLPPGWRELPVSVRVSSPQLEFDGDDEGRIVIRRDAASIKCRLIAKRRPDARDPLEVTAVFTHADRWCGTATRIFDATHAVAPPQPALSIDTDARAPDLTIHIHRTEADRRRLVWTLQPAIAHRALFETGTAETTLPDDPAVYVRAQFRDAAAARPGLHVSKLQGFGEDLWQLAPRALHDGYWAMRDQLGAGFSIQLITDEPHLPWELMRPLRKGTDTQLLAETHPIARGLQAYPHRLRQHLPLPSDDQIVTIAPDYHARSSTLPPLLAASDESAQLCERHHAVRIAPISARKLLDTLSREHATPVRLLHFAGHGHADAAIAQSWLACEDDDVTISQIRRQETRLGERYHTFVILNACEAGAAGDVLGEVGGWAEALLYREFSGLIAPLWAVFDEHARTAMLSLFDAILTQRKPIAEALRDVRAEHGRYSPTPLSYVFYGDVHARFQ